MLARPRQTKGVASVYLVAADEHRTKIGLANDPRKRLGTLRTGSSEPLSLGHQWRLVGRDGAAALERELHARFAFARIRREWFAISQRYIICVGDQLIAGDPRVAKLTAAIQRHWECWRDHDQMSARYRMLNPRRDREERVELMEGMEDARHEAADHYAAALNLGLVPTDWDTALELWRRKHDARQQGSS